MVVHKFTIGMEQVSGYEFRVRFDKPRHPELTMDEPPPLGADAGPNAARILAAAIGNCLSASLLFCPGKARLKLERIRAEVKVEIVRNQSGRLRVGRVAVTIDPGLDEAERERARRCVGIFEDFCTVTQSIRQGIDVRVAVKGFHEQ